jgi:hypothetical protein
MSKILSLAMLFVTLNAWALDLSIVSQDAAEAASETLQNVSTNEVTSLGTPRLISNEDNPRPRTNLSVWAVDVFAGSEVKGTPVRTITIQCYTHWSLESRYSWVTSDECVEASS